MRIPRLITLIAANFLFIPVALLMNAPFFLPFEQKTRIRAAGCRIWARTLAGILGISVKSNRAPRRIPGTARLIAGNHMSFLDIVAYGSLTPSVFVAKKEVRHWPIVGLLAWLSGTVFVDRESKRSSVRTVRKMKRLARSGVDIILFPEGTTSDGRGLLPFKSAFFDLAVSMKIPVVPVSIWYSSIDGKPSDPGHPNPVAWYAHMNPGSLFWKILSYREIVCRVLYGTGISISEGPGERKRLAREASEQVLAGLQILQGKDRVSE